MVRRPDNMGKFEFVVLAKLRVAQLVRGCRPRLEGVHKATVMAQMEVAEHKVMELVKTVAPELVSEPTPVEV